MRRAIALLLTLFFIILITISLGVGLGYMKKMTSMTQQEQFMIQSRTLVDDFLTMLKSSKELQNLAGEDNNTQGFYDFLSAYSTLPLANDAMDVLIELSSARSKLNPNSLISSDTTLQTKRFDALKNYLSRNNADPLYADIMLDVLNTDAAYYTQSDIFQIYPSLPKGLLFSKAQQEILTTFFTNRYHDTSLHAIDFEKIFIYSKDPQTKIDLNVASPELWSLISGCDLLRAQQLAQRSTPCSDLECFELLDEEKERLKLFAYSFYEPILQIKLTLRQNEMRAYISFEYDVKQKKGSNFVYQI